MSFFQRFRSLAAVFLFVLMAAPAAQAEVRVAFWSQDTGEYFPHAFITLRGYTEDGELVNESFGFTVQSLTPMILFSDVPGRVDFTETDYLMNSDVWFETVISDEQLARVQSLAVEWSEEGDNTYSLNNRNCIHFVAEAMRRSGLKVEMPDKLMKKPKTFTRYIGELNAGEVLELGMTAPEYYAFVERRDAARVAAANDNTPVQRARTATEASSN